jgi:MFS family permease
VVFIALITALCLLGDSALYALLPSRLDAFAISPTGAGLVLGVNRYIRILSNSGAGWIVQRVGATLPLAFAVLLGAATTLAYGALTGFWFLLIARALWGVAWSFLRLTGYLAAAETGDPRAVGRHMGVFQSVSRAGSLVAVVVGGVLADRIGARDTFLLFGVVTLSALVLVPMARIPRELGRARRATASATPSTKTTPNALDMPNQTWRIRNLYAQASINWFLITGLFISTAGYLVRTVAGDGATLLGAVIGVGTLSGLLVATRFVADLGLSTVFGHLSDRIGRPRVVIVAQGTAAVAMAIVAMSPTLAVAIPMFTVVFTAGTALTIALNASAAEIAPPGMRSVILGRYTTWADIGSGSGPIIGLPLVTSAGFGWAYGGASALMVVAAIAYWAAFIRSRS